jgi:hypothetical protein
MAQQAVNREKLAEAQTDADAAVEAADAAMEAADAAVEAAKLAAEKLAEVGNGDGLTVGQVANPDKPATAQEEDRDWIADGYRVIRNGPQDFSVEAIFRKDGLQRFRAVNGFPSETAARQWVYDQQAEEKRS